MGRSRLICFLFWLIYFSACHCITFAQPEFKWGSPYRLRNAESLLTVLADSSGGFFTLSIDQPSMGYHRIYMRHFEPSEFSSGSGYLEEIHTGQPKKDGGGLLRPEFRGFKRIANRYYLFYQVFDPIRNQYYAAVSEISWNGKSITRGTERVLKKMMEVPAGCKVEFDLFADEYNTCPAIWTRYQKRRGGDFHHLFVLFDSTWSVLDELDVNASFLPNEFTVQRIVMEKFPLGVAVHGATPPTSRWAKERKFNQEIPVHVVYTFYGTDDAIVMRADTLQVDDLRIHKVWSLSDLGSIAGYFESDGNPDDGSGFLWFYKDTSATLRAKRFALGGPVNYYNRWLQGPAYGTGLEKELRPVLTHWFSYGGFLYWVGEFRNEGEFCQTDFRSGRLLCTPYLLCADAFVMKVSMSGILQWKLQIPRLQFLQGDKAAATGSHWAQWVDDSLYLIWNDDARNLVPDRSKYTFTDPFRGSPVYAKISMYGQMESGAMKIVGRRPPFFVPGYTYTLGKQHFVTGIKGGRLFPGVLTFP
jgi:hypothetical protein